MRNINHRYRRERAVLQMVSPAITPVPYSGSRWQSGYEDGTHERMLAQVKSTRANALTVQYADLFHLVSHCTRLQCPLFVLDFASPQVAGTPLGEECWVAIRLADFQRYVLPQLVDAAGKEGA